MELATLIIEVTEAAVDALCDCNDGNEEKAIAHLVKIRENLNKQPALEAGGVAAWPGKMQW